jgi:hypothetical protein
MGNVEGNIRQRHQEHCMSPPGAFLASTLLKGDSRARETEHQRAHETSLFRIHHLFMGISWPTGVAESQAVLH